MDPSYYIDLEHRRGAENYHPLPVVVESADGAWITDVTGRRYLDFLSAYSALNFGHRNQRLTAVAQEQLAKVTLTSRAVHSSHLGPFCEELGDLVGQDRVLPMNSGAEAVESAIKVSRAWGYRVKGVPQNQAVIVVCHGNFHGRTTTIISFSDDPDSYTDFGPYTPGFVSVEYGNIDALKAALVDKNVVAFFVEPIQGEGGVVIPPEDYLPAAAQACADAGVLFVADEIQSGLARAGTTLAIEHYGLKPDMVIMGKALGGGIMPISAIASRDDIIGVLRPGEHGSTFGGNPLALAVAREVVAMLRTGEMQQRSTELGAKMLQRLRDGAPDSVREVRGRGLWAGVEVREEYGPVRPAAMRALDNGVIAKDTQIHTLRIAPPVVIEEDDLMHGVDVVLAGIAAG
jgi:ornithine--oxo-acid transaminase